MAHFLSAYSSLLIPGAVVLVLLLLILKVANAVVRLVGMVVLIAIFVAGYGVYGRVVAIQKAALAATHQGGPRLASAAALEGAVSGPARQALATVGLNPAFLRIHVSCARPNTSVQLRYVDKGFAFGVLSHQTFDVPLDSSVRC